MINVGIYIYHDRGSYGDFMDCHWSTAQLLKISNPFHMGSMDLRGVEVWMKGSWKKWVGIAKFLGFVFVGDVFTGSSKVNHL